MASEGDKRVKYGKEIVVQECSKDEDEVEKIIANQIDDLRHPEMASPAFGAEVSLPLVKKQLCKLLDTSWMGFPTEPIINECIKTAGDYICAHAISCWQHIKGNTDFEDPHSVGQAMARNLHRSEMVRSYEVLESGILIVVIDDKWIAKNIQDMLKEGIGLWVSKSATKTAVIQVSSPSNASEMNIRNLRSAVIAESSARLLEFSNVEVFRMNHVGHWGSLDAHIESYAPEVMRSNEGLNDENNDALSDLVALWYYINIDKADRVVYVTDGPEQRRFRMLVVAAKEAGWLRVDQDQEGIFLDVIVKDLVQPVHIQNCPEGLGLADLLDKAKMECMAEYEKHAEARTAIGWTAEELETNAAAIGIESIKYAFLKNNWSRNCKFELDQICCSKGNTALYLLLTYARLFSITSLVEDFDDIEELIDTGTIVLDRLEEHYLGLRLLEFAEVIAMEADPRTLCNYVYQLCRSFSAFRSSCKVLDFDLEMENRISRILLSQATFFVMKQCFHLLGIKPLDRI